MMFYYETVGDSMLRSKILVIVPYAGLKSVFEAQQAQYPELDLDIYVGDLEEVVRFSNMFLSQKYVAIISRGGTARFIRTLSNIPVVEVEISSFDILRAIILAQQSNDRHAIVGYPNIIRPFRQICEMLQYRMDLYEIDQETNIPAFIEQLRGEGIELVIGDVVATETAKASGMSSLLITSGVESVEKALREAAQLASRINTVSKNGAAFQAAVESSDDTIVIMNHEHQMVYLNHLPEGLSISQLSDMLGAHLDDLDQIHHFHIVARYSGLRFGISGKVINDGGTTRYVFFIRGISQPFRTETSAVTILNYNDIEPRAILSPSSRAIYEKVGEFAANSARYYSLFLYGGIGVGKDTLIQAIFLRTCNKNDPLVVVDCEQLTARQWQLLIDDEKSVLYMPHFSLYLKSVHALARGLQQDLLQYFESTRFFSRHTVFSSSEYDHTDLLVSYSFPKQLYELLSGLRFYLPSLNEQPDDIPAIASMVLSQNSQEASHIIGFDNYAMEYLKSYHWKLNIEQLCATVKQLIATSDGPYISVLDLETVLSEAASSNPQYANIDISKPLDEIEQDVINKVLVRENMSQTAAAKRLGISRSTLWRKLRQ